MQFFLKTFGMSLRVKPLISVCLSLPSSPSFYLFLSLTAHTEAPSEGKPVARKPGGDSARENPSRPPSVKVIGGSPSANWARPWSLALLFAALCLQLTLFWCRHPPWIRNPAPLEKTTYTHTGTHIIYISLIVSLLLSSTCMDGWKNKNWKTRRGVEEKRTPL